MIFIFIYLFQYFQSIISFPGYDIDININKQGRDSAKTQVVQAIDNQDDWTSGSLIDLFYNDLAYDPYNASLNDQNGNDGDSTAKDRNGQLDDEFDEYSVTPNIPYSKLMMEMKFKKTRNRFAAGNPRTNFGEYPKNEESVKANAQNNDYRNFNASKENFKDEANMHNNEIVNIDNFDENNNSCKVNLNLPLTTNKDRITDFLNHLFCICSDEIKSFGYRALAALEITRNDSIVLIKKSVDTYMDMMKNHVSSTILHDIKRGIDRHFVFLDIMSSFSKNLHSEETKLLKKGVEMKARNDNDIRDRIDFLREFLFRQHVNHKKQLLLYLCENMKICRIFPGFSDYFVEIIDELLKVPDERLQLLIEEISCLVRNRPNFFHTFINREIVYLINDKFESILSNVSKLKELIFFVRSIITQRLELITTDDKLLNTKTKAARILLDIVDKTFHFSSDAEENVNLIVLNAVVRSIRKWRENVLYDVNESLKLLMRHFETVVRDNWDDDTLTDVMILTEVLMTGTTESTDILERLFSLGAVFETTGNFIPDDDVAYDQ